MFSINDDMSIWVTRGDTVSFSVVATQGDKNYVFKNGDVVRIKVVEKKDCEAVVLQKDFAVTEEAERVNIVLTENETRIGEVISKPTDYWYEVELNPHTNPQTILGYDEDGAKIFKLFPEGKDLEYEPSEEEIGTVDEELDMTSERPVQNQAIARAINDVEEQIELLREESFSVRATIKSLVEEEINPVKQNVMADLEVFKDEARADLVAMTDEVVADATEKASASEYNAKIYMDGAKEHSEDAEDYSLKAKEYMEDAFATTPEGYADVVEKVKYMDIKTSNENALLRSKEGGLKVVEIVGNSVQDGTPTPDTPITIENVGDYDEESGKYVVPVTAHGKNLIPYPYLHNTRTYGGTTITDVGDGTLTVSGTSTATHYFSVQGAFTLPKGKYKLSGCPSGGGNSKYTMILRKNGVNTDKTAIDYGDGEVFEVTDEATEYVIIICIYGVTNATDLTFKPMLCRCDENGNAFGGDDYEVYTTHVEYIYLDEPLRKGAVIVEADGEFSVNHKRGIVDLGTLTWVLVNDTYWKTTNVEAHNIKCYGNQVVADILAEKYVVCSSDYVSRNVGGISLANDTFTKVTKAMFIYCNNGSTTEKPSGLMEYEVMEETYTPLNTESQIALNNLKTFDGVTYISFDTTVQPSAFEVKYGSSDVGAGVLNNDDRLRNLEIGLSDIPVPLLLTEWVEDNGTFTQTVAVNGVKGTENPTIQISPVGDLATEDELNSFACISGVKTIEDGIVFIASEKPSISFTVIAKCVLASGGSAIVDVTAIVGRVSELETEVDGLNRKINDNIMIKNFTKEGVAFSNTANVKPFEDVDISLEGYEPIGVVGHGFGFASTDAYRNVNVVGCAIIEGVLNFRAITTSGSYSGIVSVDIMYKKIN